MLVHHGRRAGGEIAPVKPKIKNQNKTEGQLFLSRMKNIPLGGEKFDRLRQR